MVEGPVVNGQGDMVEGQWSMVEGPWRKWLMVDGRGAGGRRGMGNVEHPTSNVQHPTSNVQHPTSNVERGNRREPRMDQGLQPVQRRDASYLYSRNPATNARNDVGLYSLKLASST